MVLAEAAGGLLPELELVVEEVVQPASKAQHRLKNAMGNGVGRMGEICLTKEALVVEDDSPVQTFI
jgi:hypothetical protein